MKSGPKRPPTTDGAKSSSEDGSNYRVRTPCLEVTVEHARISVKHWVLYPKAKLVVGDVSTRNVTGTMKQCSKNLGPQG